MQKLVEERKWEHQNKESWLKLIEMQGNLDKNMVGTGFR
jgi:hypothetical protein